MTDEDQGLAPVAAVTERLGPVDVLVANATGPQPEGPLEVVEWAAYMDHLEFFVKSPVLPGRAVVTGMRGERHATVTDAVRSAYVASVPAGRFGSPEDVAHAVSFFASDQAGFITGQRLDVDGGRGLA